MLADVHRRVGRALVLGVGGRRRESTAGLRLRQDIDEISLAGDGAQLQRVARGQLCPVAHVHLGGAVDLDDSVGLGAGDQALAFANGGLNLDLIPVQRQCLQCARGGQLRAAADVDVVALRGVHLAVGAVGVVQYADGGGSALGSRLHERLAVQPQVGLVRGARRPGFQYGAAVQQDARVVPVARRLLGLPDADNGLHRAGLEVDGGIALVVRGHVDVLRLQLHAVGHDDLGRVGVALPADVRVDVGDAHAHQRPAAGHGSVGGSHRVGRCLDGGVAGQVDVHALEHRVEGLGGAGVPVQVAHGHQAVLARAVGARGDGGRHVPFFLPRVLLPQLLRGIFDGAGPDKQVPGLQDVVFRVAVDRHLRILVHQLGHPHVNVVLIGLVDLDVLLITVFYLQTKFRFRQNFQQIRQVVMAGRQIHYCINQV